MPLPRRGLAALTLVLVMAAARSASAAPTVIRLPVLDVDIAPFGAEAYAVTAATVDGHPAVRLTKDDYGEFDDTELIVEVWQATGPCRFTEWVRWAGSSYEPWFGAFDAANWRWDVCYRFDGDRWLFARVSGFQSYDHDDAAADADEVLGAIEDAVEAQVEAQVKAHAGNAPAPPPAPPPEDPFVGPEPSFGRPVSAGSMTVTAQLLRLSTESVLDGETLGGAVGVDWVRPSRVSRHVDAVIEVQAALGGMTDSGMVFDVEGRAGFQAGRGFFGVEGFAGAGADALGTADPEPLVFRMPAAAMWLAGAAMRIGDPSSTFAVRLEYSHHGRGGDAIDSESRLGLRLTLAPRVTSGVTSIRYAVDGVQIASLLEAFVRLDL